MAYQVRIRQADRPVSVEPGQTILEAALAQGVAYPHGCRSGNCGACKSRCYAGELELAPYSDYALSGAERASGLILACRAVPWSDAEVGWLDADELMVHPIRHLTCRVRALEQATHDIRVVRLEILSGGPFSFSAGQYARVRFDDLPARDYSMANRPDQPDLELHIRQMGGGGASVYAGTRLAVGDIVTVEGPYGTSYLRERHTGPILAVAGGSGLAPITSIVESALARGMQQPIRLYFGVRDERDLYREAALTALAAAHPNFRFTPVLSEPHGPTARRTGFVHQVVAGELGDVDGMKAYLAGPPPMVEAASAMLTERGVRREDIHADAFYTEAEKATLGGAP
ncbi:MAG TPA: 2Fe-2S iron-sulfur cluster-binding protein [Candidatus Sulfotelmatobacter sp.]|nr:2Fe-2S iron-sulfur cluster-binding protein [Candidatus Sulfotelmatobacter sp.]